MTLRPLPMDLSSLEGPPIADPRFTMSIPQIHLDHALFATPHPEPEPEQRLRASYLPQRPASADALAHPRQKHRHQHRQRNQPHLTLDTNTSRHSYTPTTTYNNAYAYARARAHAHAHAPSSQHTHHPARAPRRLTWIESESIWIITSAGASPSSPSSTWGDVNWAAASRRPPVLTHSRSMDLSLRQTQAVEEVPPPYERHYFDRPLGGQMLAVGGSDSDSGSTFLYADVDVRGEYRDGTAEWPGSVGGEGRGSRWTEIARRMNRSPFG
ncbi:uncharacterized protein ACLA_028710 [Aspergillus clavatus NRRL 1]|uniref:Uncharacterized protein n=1 Tax=Aspergillus clavatus (strain ATCC 1007 / CBS 513.65 / DSM 816 / NCTC 3887 / NRRL 1 / QM 1276 / 107) TaxID=344612 RepID=A1CR75_ASPCL|nr:uncharacterized protein ACLA_028710 [Aspergillus clavatus NRRL 1]EAW08146.1 conserved hypothetical protein [Aspergillus clavatus NRRL 1]